MIELMPNEFWNHEKRSDFKNFFIEKYNAENPLESVAELYCQTDQTNYQMIDTRDKSLLSTDKKVVESSSEHIK